MSRRIVLAGIAAIFTAMLGRMGWIKWPDLLSCAGIVLVVLVVLVIGTVIVALPLFLILAIIEAGLRLAGRPKFRPAAPHGINRHGPSARVPSLESGSSWPNAAGRPVPPAKAAGSAVQHAIIAPARHLA